MRRYVLGFVFDSGYHNVLLICKDRPSWQAGRLNGLGGKIEEGESPARAMERELREETAGRLGNEVELGPYGRLQGGSGSRTASEGWEVWLFWGKLRGGFPPSVGRVATDEGMIQVVSREDLSSWPVLPNLRYLVPMAVNHARGIDRACFFEIVESGAPSEVVRPLTEVPR